MVQKYAIEVHVWSTSHWYLRQGIIGEIIGDTVYLMQSI